MSSEEQIGAASVTKSLPFPGICLTFHSNVLSDSFGAVKTEEKSKDQFIRNGLILTGILASDPVGNAADVPRNFRTYLSGDGLPVPVVTRAQGQAIFQLTAERTALHHKRSVANIEDFFMVHIHAGLPDKNGPVVAWL